MLNIKCGGEISPALTAIYFFLLFMDFNVFVQICLLSEGLRAPSIETLERTLLGVNSQMIEEVVPLSEKHSTVHMLTLQDFHESLGLWVLILVDFKISSVRYRLIYFKRLCIKVVTRDDLNFVDRFRDLGSDLIVTNLITSYYFCYLIVTVMI